METHQNEQTSGPPGGRRTFLRGWLAATSLAVAGFFGGRSVRLGAAAEAEAASLPEQPGNTLLRQQEELRAALTRPIAARRWVMLIDVRRCVGCHACVVACRAENVVGPEGSYRRVPEAPAGSFPNTTNVFMPTNCVQCDDPPCARAVPAGLIQKRPDGIVQFDYSRLKGEFAHAAAAACPYRAAHVDEGDHFTQMTPRLQPYELRDFAEYNGIWNRRGGSSLTGSARKCHFCAHALDAGMLPACVSTCIGGAMYFGDAADPNSLVSQLKGTHRTIRLHQELGIEPRVYYIEEKLAQVRQYSCATCH